MIAEWSGAIRFLRAKASEYGYSTDRLAIAGSSSGGHLATLVGVSNNHPALEGNVGDHLKQSSEVQAIIDYFGASNLTSILSQSTPHGLNVREPALDLLLGGQPDQLPELDRLASPVFHIAIKAILHSSFSMGTRILKCPSTSPTNWSDDTRS